MTNNVMAKGRSTKGKRINHKGVIRRPKLKDKQYHG